MIEVLLLTQVAATFVMVGVIWFVQIVHYPLMARVSASEFAAYEREHQNRTTFVVAPTMLIEAVAATLLLVVVPPGLGRILSGGRNSPVGGDLAVHVPASGASAHAAGGRV